MMSVFVNLSVVLNNHEQFQDCLTILELPCLGISSIVLLRKLIFCKS